LLLPTSSKPCSCFSSSPLKQSSEATAAVSKDASGFPDLKGRKSGCNLLVEEEEEEEDDNSSTVPVAAAKEETDLQSSNSRLRLQQGAASKQQEEEKEQLTICLSTRIPQHRTKLACISLSNPHKLPETTVLIDMLEEEEEGCCCCCCLDSSRAHPAALICLSAQKLKKP
jgi:hypothetical protein